MKIIYIVVYVYRGFIREPEIFLDEVTAIMRKQEILKNFNQDYDEIQIFEKKISF